MITKRRTIDNSIEEKILTGLITNTNFCRDVSRAINKNTFVIPYAQIISKWVLDYFKQYHQSPEKHIQDIFELEKINLKDGNKELVSAFLTKLSSDYEQEKEFNTDFLRDKAIKYIKKQNLKAMGEKVQHLLELDKIEEAEKELGKYKQVAKETLGSFDPFTDFEVKQFFTEMEDKSNVMLTLPGALGQLLGSLERHWLVGILAPSKRGKTFWQQEFAINAIMEKKKVFFISLEMDKNRVKKRLYKRMTAYGDTTKEFIYPCFDCLKNQRNSCKKNERINRTRLTDDVNIKPKQFDPAINYVPCTVCRGKKDFAVGTWYTSIKREGMKLNNTLKIVRGIKQAFGDRLRIKSYPKFSANIHDIMAALNELETVENFIPDVIIIDYADILAPEDSRITGRDRIDETWKTMGRLADEHHCLVISASQSNRKSFDKKYIEVTDIAEDIRKVANSDMFISLNQTKDEKREGVVRVNVISDRDSSYDTHMSCLVLQQLDLGQVCLDSELFAASGENEEDIL